MIAILMTAADVVFTARPCADIRYRTGRYRLTPILGAGEQNLPSRHHCDDGEKDAHDAMAARRISVLLSMFDTIAASAAGVFGAGAHR